MVNGKIVPVSWQNDHQLDIPIADLDGFLDGVVKLIADDPVYEPTKKYAKKIAKKAAQQPKTTASIRHLTRDQRYGKPWGYRMKLSAITEASLVAPPAQSIGPGVDRANTMRAALAAGIPAGKISRMFGVSRARLSAIKRRLLEMGWQPGMPITPEMLTRAKGVG